MFSKDKVSRVLFMTGGGGRHRLFYEIAQELKRRYMVEDYYASFLPRNRKFLLDKKVDEDKIKDIKQLYSDTSKPDINYIRKCERNYELNIWDVWNVTRIRKEKRSKIPREEVLSYFDYIFRKSEEILEEIKPDYLICYGVAGYHTITLYKVARKKGVEIILLKPASIKNNFVISNDLENNLPLLKLNYQKIKIKGLTDKEKEETSKFVQKFINKPEKAPMAAHPLSRYLKYKKIKRTLKGMAVDRKLPTFFFNEQYFKLRKWFFRNMNIFEFPKENEKFVLFPLHQQPEISTSIYGKWYMDQINTLQLLSKSIPVDYMLYVKEHFRYGNRNLSFYKEIKKLPNTRLISFHTNTFNLIKRCSLLATITGTMGFEALFFRKPVITFGNAFYNTFDEVEKIEKIAELPKIIEKKLEKGLINEEKLLEFMFAYQNSFFEGIPRYPEACDDKSIEKENIIKLVDGIEDYLELIQEI
ncbi:MAG: hypothetical protein ABEK36_01765 [Candidatus Aenigmatarchaeota archaeon]